MSSTQTLKLRQVVANRMDVAKAFAERHAMAGLTSAADEAGQPVTMDEDGARFVFDANSKHITLGDGEAAARCLQAVRCLLGRSSRPPNAWTGPAVAA